MGGKRGGRGRGVKKGNTINYHGIVITSSKTRNRLFNMNKIFSNYILNNHIENVDDPFLRSILIRTLNYIIKKRQFEINREYGELNKLTNTPMNMSLKKRYESKIKIHENMLEAYKTLLKFYTSKTPFVINTKNMFNVYKTNYNKVYNNQKKQYRYFSKPNNNGKNITLVILNNL